MSATDDDLVPELWRYTGRCSLTGGKIGHTYITPAGVERVFSKAPKSPAIGGIYRVQVTPDGKAAVVNTAEWMSQAMALEADLPLPPAATDEDLLGWRLADRAFTASIEADRARKRAAADNGNIGDLTLDQVRELMARGLPAQRTGTLAAVLAYLR